MRDNIDDASTLVHVNPGTTDGVRRPTQYGREGSGASDLIYADVRLHIPMTHDITSPGTLVVDWTGAPATKHEDYRWHHFDQGYPCKGKLMKNWLFVIPDGVGDADSDGSAGTSAGDGRGAPPGVGVGAAAPAAPVATDGLQESVMNNTNLRGKRAPSRSPALNPPAPTGETSLSLCSHFYQHIHPVPPASINLQVGTCTTLLECQHRR